MTVQLELAQLKRAWIDNALKAFDSRAFCIGTFTADDLRAYIGEPPHPNWTGCFVAALRSRGRIKEVGRVKSTRPKRNGAKIGLYEVV